MQASEEKAHILIIDDEPGVRNVLYTALNERYECTAVGSAEEALSLLSAENFDLVISDINMGGISSLEMIPQVKASAPNTAVMMISGEQTIECAIEALRVGAFDYIIKPFDLQPTRRMNLSSRVAE
jgi:DNA-binding NtrC family response regulator